MLYCAYNSCTLMSDYPLETFVFELNKTIETQQVNSIVIDLRRNHGGNSMLAAPLVSWLSRQSASGTAVSLIIGRWTFSSGILNSVEISEIPGVRVYGENSILDAIYSDCGSSSSDATR